LGFIPDVKLHQKRSCMCQSDPARNYGSAVGEKDMPCSIP